MHLLISKHKLNTLKSRDLIPLKCKYCKNTFYRTKNKVQSVLKGNSVFSLNYCSCKCNVNTQKTKSHIICVQCSHKFFGYTDRKFCSQNCAGTYNNNHKTKGYRRSKLENWIETNLTKLYPKLKIDYNKTDAINAELDIYIPSLKLAFELNGIFHYEPIYSKEKLKSTQLNDKRKFQACIENGIELCIIDTSSQKYFKENSSQKYFEIIKKLVENKTH
jgi:hypothetical protein